MPPVEMKDLFIFDLRSNLVFQDQILSQSTQVFNFTYLLNIETVTFSMLKFYCVLTPLIFVYFCKEIARIANAFIEGSLDMIHIRDR